ncbi:hypothetical protein HQ584_08000 [Patescibacteria group bacterium]|nr:hypothetical protein [Patescibacteria group bacterium]
MIDKISGGITITGGILQFLKFVKELAGSDIISGYFRYDGTKVKGSNKIEIELIKDGNDKNVFWLSVKAHDDYAFIHMPINELSVHELIGTKNNEIMPDPAYWRWVQKPKPNVIVGGNYTPPNAKMDFIIIGYKPKALINYFSNDKT